jgi:Holliday junction resolvase
MGNLGTGREYVVRDQLARLGYYVMRSPASKGPVDLVAIRPGVVLFVQVKRGASRLRPSGWNDLLSAARQYGAVPVLAEAVPRRPVAWWRLLAAKVPNGRAQPREIFDPERP